MRWRRSRAKALAVAPVRLPTRKPTIAFFSASRATKVYSSPLSGGSSSERCACFLKTYDQISSTWSRSTCRPPTKASWRRWHASPSVRPQRMTVSRWTAQRRSVVRIEQPSNKAAVTRSRRHCGLRHHHGGEQASAAHVAARLPAGGGRPWGGDCEPCPTGIPDRQF